MFAGLHRFLVSWVSLFFLSDDRLHSLYARAIRTSYGPGDIGVIGPDLHRSELSVTSPREQLNAQATPANTRAGIAAIIRQYQGKKQDDCQARTGTSFACFQPVRRHSCDCSGQIVSRESYFT